MMFNWVFSNDDLEMIGLILLLIGLLCISLWILTDWLIEIFRSVKNDR